MRQMPSAEYGVRGFSGGSSTLLDLALPFRTPHPALRTGLRLALLLLVVAATPARAQNEPLRKTDLIRYLSAGSMTTTQIAQLVQRNCVSFTPTARDRQNLMALGADTMIMARIDGCLKRPAAGGSTAATQPSPSRPSGSQASSSRPSPSRPSPVQPPPSPPSPAVLIAVPIASRVQAVVGGTAEVSVALKRGSAAVPGTLMVLRGSGRISGGSDALAETDGRGIAQFRFPAGGSAGSVRLTIATVSGEALSASAEVELTMMMPLGPPARARPAPDRTGFVQGTGQRGRAGEPASLPVVFEARDSAGRVMPGLQVTLSVVNGRLAGDPTEATTDSNGQVSVQVTFGERAGVATAVVAKIGSLERQAMLYPMPGPAKQLIVLLDGNTVAGQVVLSTRRSSVLRIYSRDAFGNSVPVGGLQATSADERVLKVTAVSADSLGGVIAVTPRKAGLTNLVITSSGLRADLSALIR